MTSPDYTREPDDENAPTQDDYCPVCHGLDPSHKPWCHLDGPEEWSEP